MGENVFSYFQTLFVVSPVSRHIFSYFKHKSVQKWEKMDFHFLPFLDTFCRFSCFQTHFLLFQTQKCLEMGMIKKALLTRGPNNLLDVQMRDFVHSFMKLVKPTLSPFSPILSKSIPLLGCSRFNSSIFWFIGLSVRMISHRIVWVKKG